MKLNYFILSATCCMSIAYAQSDKPQSDKPQPPNAAEVKRAKIQEDLLPGRSSDNPIVIKKTKNDVELKDEQRSYIDTLGGNYLINNGDLFMLPDGRIMESLLLNDMANEDAESIAIYFDITKTCKNTKNFKDKIFKERVEKVLKKGPPEETMIIVPAASKPKIRATMKDCPLKERLLASPETQEEADKIRADRAAKKGAKK